MPPYRCLLPGLLVLAIAVGSLLAPAKKGTPPSKPLRVLIIDGRNNHDWRITTDAVRAALLATGRFEVEVSTAPELKLPSVPRPPKSDDPEAKKQFDDSAAAFARITQPAKKAFGENWKNWRPNFDAYDVVVLNYNGQSWPAPTKAAFVDYVRNGGGVLLVHAANNAFRDWPEFDDIIGIGWRPAGHGTAIKVDPKSGKAQPSGAQDGSAHGSKHPFQITVRQPNHPVMQGLPPVWMHARDELYHRMRGPAKNLSVLSSAYSDPKQRGTGDHEPITWEVPYGKGRSIVTSLGHCYQGEKVWDALHCVGFQTIVARSCEYLASGNVTLPLPKEFPNADTASVITPSGVTWSDAPKPPDPADAAARAKKKENPYGMLSPAEERATFDLPPGYIAELVAAEPDVQEPVLTVFDGNGVLYVAEMRSYMQNVEGAGTKTLKNGRIKRFEDTTGDGRFDRATSFVDKLNLPRAILPLDDRIAVRETDTMDVVSYRDTDGDGVADERELLYKRGPYGRGNVGTSVEHQDSGLVWNLDNNIYLSYNLERYRFTDGTWRPEKQRSHWTQWGLTHNNLGDLYWVHNSDPVSWPYLHPKYWNNITRLAGRGIHGTPIDMGKPYDPEFMQVKSHCLLNDRGGSAAEDRAFTSACGQTIFRGHALPWTDYGDHFVCDPTIHVVRRSSITKKSGLDFFAKTEPGDAEFLRSSDINSRFVNTATGPDGCLYVTDMYRGIIQDAPWLSPGPRKAIVAAGLDKNIQHGRIWRIRHADHTPVRPPRMLEETTVQLLRHLEHDNGWWRDTTQKLIILRADRESVVPHLKGMARFGKAPLTRLHALWTLEGIGVLDQKFVGACFGDRDWRIRRAAIQIAERWIDEANMLKLITPLTEDRDAQVAQQLILTLGMNKGDTRPHAENLIQEAAKNHLKDRGVILATGVALWGNDDLPLIRSLLQGKGHHPSVILPWQTALVNWNRGIQFPKNMDATHRRLVRDGEVIYYASCVSCHGADGKGVTVPGTDLRLAPSLVDSPRVKGAPSTLVPILLHGLTGPLDGKTYQSGFMAPGIALGLERDRDYAQVLSFIRYAWDGKRDPITEEEVKRIRIETKDRELPWTQKELEDR